MRVDLYRRAESGQKFSYPVVPQIAEKGYAITGMKHQIPPEELPPEQKTSHSNLGDVNGR
jgi:hypothetical protein